MVLLGMVVLEMVLLVLEDGEKMHLHQHQSLLYKVILVVLHLLLVVVQVPVAVVEPVLLVKMAMLLVLGMEVMEVMALHQVYLELLLFMLVAAVVDFMHTTLLLKVFLVEKVELVAAEMVVEIWDQMKMKQVIMELKVSAEAEAEAVMNTVVDLLGVVLVGLELL